MEAAELACLNQARDDHFDVDVRRVMAEVYETLRFWPELRRAKIIRDGTDVLFVSSGLMTMRVLEAAFLLKNDHIDAAVLHVSTIKPLDETTLLTQIIKPGRLIVIVENHTVIGGLGEAVLALAMRKGLSGRMRQIGLPDAFLDAGALQTLHDKYGISTSRIVAQVKTWM